MDDVMLAWWIRTRGADADERGATVIEYLMVVALFVAAAVLVASLGASFRMPVGPKGGPPGGSATGKPGRNR